MMRLVICILIFSLQAFDQAAANQCPELAHQFRENSTKRLVEGSNYFEITKQYQLIERQYLALQILSKNNISSKIAQQAKLKLNSYPKPLINKNLSDLSRFENPENLRIDALEFILKTFASISDRPIRKECLAALSDFPNTTLRTVETLLPILRGSKELYGSEIHLAHSALRKIMMRLHNNHDFLNLYFTSRTFENIHSEPQQSFFDQAKLISVENFDTGSANSTIKVSMEVNGQRIHGIFKPLMGEAAQDSATVNNLLFTREVQAFEFFSAYFEHLQIRIPETREVILTTDRQSYGVGSIQFFLPATEGWRTLNEFYGGANGKPVSNASVEYLEVWPRQNQDSRWKPLAPWVRVFDFIIGNTDRFPNSKRQWGNPNNILMREVGNHLEVALIDNGNGRRFRRLGEYVNANSSFKDLPTSSQIPPKLKSVILKLVEQKTEISRRFSDTLSPQGVNDMLNRIDLVAAEILR
jgi:hypothetical protein